MMRLFKKKAKKVILNDQIRQNIVRQDHWKKQIDGALRDSYRRWPCHSCESGDNVTTTDGICPKCNLSCDLRIELEMAGPGDYDWYWSKQLPEEQ